MNNFKLNLKSTIVSFFTLLLLSSLFFNAYAESSDEKNAISKELTYLNKNQLI